MFQKFGDNVCTMFCFPMVTGFLMEKEQVVETIEILIVDHGGIIHTPNGERRYGGHSLRT